MYSTAFHKELLKLLNRHTLEKESRTPDYIIAAYLMDCLAVYDERAAGHGED